MRIIARRMKVATVVAWRSKSRIRQRKYNYRRADRLGNAAAIFASLPILFFQESRHLIPYRLFQLIAAYGVVMAYRLATEPITVRTGAMIVAHGVHRIVLA